MAARLTHPPGESSGAGYSIAWPTLQARLEVVGHAGDGLERPAAALSPVGAAGDRIGVRIAVDLLEVPGRVEPGLGDAVAGPEAVAVRAGQHLAARRAAEAGRRRHVVPRGCVTVVAAHRRFKHGRQI